MKNVKAVSLAEAAMKFQNLAEHAPEHHERRLTVRIQSPGGIGGTPTVDVVGIHVGIDIDAHKIILHTDHPLTKLTPEQAEAVVESVKLGQSWHALETYRAQQHKLNEAQNLIDKMGRALKTIADGVGLQDYYPSREEAPDATLAELVLEKVLPGMELAETLIKLPVNGLPVVRDENGLWRHPAYPRFGTGPDASKRYAEWFRTQGMTFTTTYLLCPLAEDVIDGDYSNWSVVPPNGAGWFLLAIEDFVDDPVCVWGHRMGQAGGA